MSCFYFLRKNIIVNKDRNYKESWENVIYIVNIYRRYVAIN